MTVNFFAQFCSINPEIPYYLCRNQSHNHNIMKKTTTPRAPLFDREWTDMINLLPEHRRRTMESDIRTYQLTGTEPHDLEGAEMMAFLLIKKTVDRRYRLRLARQRKKQEKEAILEPRTEESDRLPKNEKPATIPIPEQNTPSRKNIHGPLGDIERLRRKSTKQKSRPGNKHSGTGLKNKIQYRRTEAAVI